MTVPYRADGLGYDRSIAALFFHAKLGETVSTMAGRGQAARKPWACVLCRVLDAVVERGHCARSIVVDGITANGPAIRAGFAMVLGFVMPFSFACWAVWDVAFWLVSMLYARH